MHKNTWKIKYSVILELLKARFITSRRILNRPYWKELSINLMQTCWYLVATFKLTIVNHKLHIVEIFQLQICNLIRVLPWHPQKRVNLKLNTQEIIQIWHNPLRKYEAASWIKVTFTIKKWLKEKFLWLQTLITLGWFLHKYGMTNFENQMTVDICTRTEITRKQESEIQIVKIKLIW